MTRCKFYCSSKTERLATVYEKDETTGRPEGKTVSVWDFQFHVVGEGTPEDNLFFASTPTGEMKVTTVRNDTFKIGQKYYLDFTEAP